MDYSVSIIETFLTLSDRPASKFCRRVGCDLYIATKTALSILGSHASAQLLIDALGADDRYFKFVNIVSDG